MKKFLALVLTLAMVLTMSVSIFASTAAAGSINVAGQSTVTVDGVTYTVIDDLAAITAKGNYILSKDVAVAKNVLVTIPAGTVLNGNGYTISVANNSFESPITKAPFALAAGEKIEINNVKFGTAEAPVVFESAAPATLDAVADDLSLFVEAGEGVIASFKDVTFSVYAFDEAVNVNTAAVVAYATGSYTFEGCVADVEFDTGDMAALDLSTLTYGYTGGFIGYAPKGSSLSFNNCATAVGSTMEVDYRTGGFVGGLDGAVSVTNCVNNAVITNLTLCTGGFIGWVGQADSKSNNLSSWTMDNCVNHGDITAYIGAYTNAEGKAATHGDSGRTAAALVGYFYKNEEGTSPQIIVTNCTNTGNISGEDRLSGMIGDNRISYQVDKTNTLFQWADADGDGIGDENGYKIGYNYNPTKVINCVNYGDVTCIVKDAASGAHVMGGFASRTNGPTIFQNCANYGSVNANGMKDGHLGGIVGNTSAGSGACKNVAGYIELENCTNYGLLINGRRIAGMIGASESPTKMTNCTNYGTVYAGLGSEAHNGTLTDNGILCGGFTGMTDAGTHYFTNCVNYGNIESLVVAAGIAACSRANGPIFMDNCINYGKIGSDDLETGGLIGFAKADVTITNSINAGKLESYLSFVAGQIVSRAELGITIENCYVFGTILGDSFDPNADGILGYMCDRGDAIVCPDGKVMAYVIGTAEEITDARNQAVTADKALEMVKAIDATAPVHVEDGILTRTFIDIRGAQADLEATGDTTSIRIAGVTAGVEFEKVTFSYKVNGAAAKTADGTALETITATNYSGAEETKTAQHLGGDKMFTFVVGGVAATGTVTIEVEMIATYKGAEFKTAATITVVDGVIADPAAPAAA